MNTHNHRQPNSRQTHPALAALTSICVLGVTPPLYRRPHERDRTYVRPSNRDRRDHPGNRGLRLPRARGCPALPADGGAAPHRGRRPPRAAALAPRGARCDPGPRRPSRPRRASRRHRLPPNRQDRSRGRPRAGVAPRSERGRAPQRYKLFPEDPAPGSRRAVQDEAERRPFTPLDNGAAQDGAPKSCSASSAWFPPSARSASRNPRPTSLSAPSASSARACAMPAARVHSIRRQPSATRWRKAS